jgi:hypothetical protein
MENSVTLQNIWQWMRYKGRVIFRQYIPKERKCFGIKIYKLCDKSDYTYDVCMCLGKDLALPLTTWLQHVQLLDI